MEIFFIDSPIGTLQIFIIENKLYSISRPVKSLEIPLNLKSKKNALIISLKNLDKRKGYNFQQKQFLPQKKLSPLAQSLKKQLNSFFEGKGQEFKIPLYERGTLFQQKVWKALKQIPYAETRTYSEIAKSINNKKASRAVGNCCSKNPFLIVIPCHRVLSKTGLGGFALGLKIKKHLLRLEKSFLKGF
ncbi:MAG: methylated-DNA--[protein]-cysteine S-methyltransferase [Bdellovibrionales bacterium]|nr:methylated-DNA--[protein]-cysteine S-methyltransferase [Bdellovibrionales bacterium]